MCACCLTEARCDQPDCNFDFLQFSKKFRTGKKRAARARQIEAKILLLVARARGAFLVLRGLFKRSCSKFLRNLFHVHDDTLPVACGVLKHRTAKVRDVIT